jgi:hypothetical protein
MKGIEVLEAENRRLQDENNRQVQILKNQQVILLVLKTLVPNDAPLFYTVGDHEYNRPNDWLIEVIDKCVEDSNNLLPLIGEVMWNEYLC